MKLNKLIPLLVLTGCMTSCTSYSSKPGKIENLLGTYELVTYKMRHEVENQEAENEADNEADNEYDKKAEIGAVAYFSIDKDGYGYYGYKDNSTAARVDSVFTTFTYDDDKPSLIKAITMKDGVTHKYDYAKAPGCLDEPTMGFRSELFKKTLNYTVHSGHMLFDKKTKIPYRFVEYKRISKDASLAKVNSLLGTNVSFSIPYEMKAMTGYAVYRCLPKDGEAGNKGIYEYAILDLDSYSNGQLDLIYSLKEAPGQQTKKLDVSVAEKGKTMKLELEGKSFYSVANGDKLSMGNFDSRYDEYDDTDPYYSESFSLYWSTDATIESIIQEETASV